MECKKCNVAITEAFSKPEMPCSTVSVTAAGPSPHTLLGLSTMSAIPLLRIFIIRAGPPRMLTEPIIDKTF